MTDERPSSDPADEPRPDTPASSGPSSRPEPPVSGAPADPAPPPPVAPPPPPAMRPSPAMPPPPPFGAPSPTFGAAPSPAAPGLVPGPAPSPGPAPGPGAPPGFDPTGGGATGPGPMGAGPGGPGYGPEQPPAITAFAWRHGLVRPKRGRLLAGVCAGFGRATNTDPILWRVVLAVLAIFGGIGVIAYLVGWLFVPAEGDTATPVEALVGRGRSSTSAFLTVIGGVIMLISAGVALSEPFRPGLVGAVLLGGVVLLLLRDQRGKVRAAGTAPATMPMWSTATGPVAGAAPPAGPSGPPGAPEPPTLGEPRTPPPFAPYGPFAPGPPQSAYPGGAPPQPPPVPAPPVFPPRPPTPRPRPPRSRLGLLILSVALIVVGALTVFRLAGFYVPAGGYAAAALATVGCGLILGAWFGRARWMIAIGVVLALSVALSAGADRMGDRNFFNRFPVHWTPITVDDIQGSYRHDFGNATLDLSQVDFSQKPDAVYVDARVDFGDLIIIVPPRVDVYVTANVDVGSAEVFGRSWGGLDSGTQSIVDYDTDGQGGGELHLDARADVGKLEVRR